MKLYELTQHYNELLTMLNTDADNEAINDTLDLITDSLTDKAENIAKLLNALDGDILMIKTEEQRLAERRRVIENRRDNLKDYLKQSLENAEIKKVDTPLFTISIRTNPHKVEVMDEASLPERFFERKEIISVLKKDILEAYKQGEIIEGVLITQGTSLQIK